MNNSFNKKMNQKLKINLNDLSSTSSEFFLDYNKKKSIKQKGGKCSCMDMFKALSNQNLELILYILKQNNCCFKCQNSDGNTILHLLIPYYNSNEEFTNQINSILATDCSDFINIQNNQGQTPILLAVMEDHDDLAELMENAGADITIEDNNGNFVGSKNDENDENNNNNDQQQTEIGSEVVPIQNIYNVFNFIVQNPQKPELSSLGINDISEYDPNDMDNLNLNTDDFMKKIKNNISDSLDKNFQDNKINEMDDSSSSSSSSEYVDLPEIESSVSSMNTDKFITLLDENKNPSFFNYSDIQDTDQFITILRDKYSSQTNNKKNDLKNSNNNNQNLNPNLNPNLNMNPTNKQPTKPNNELNNITSDMESSINTQMIKLENESTSDNFVSDNSAYNNPNPINIKSNNSTLNNLGLDNDTSDNKISDDKTSDNLISNNMTSEFGSDNTKSNQNNLSRLENSDTSASNIFSNDLLKLRDESTSDNFVQSQNLNPQSNPQTKNLTDNNDIDKLQTSNIPESINGKQKLNSKATIFYKNNTNNKESAQLKNLSSSDIDTNTLLKAIKKIQNNYENEISIDMNNNLMKGGASKKQQIMGYRNLNSDSDILFINSKKNKSLDIDYNSLYNSDSEYGMESNKNELKRMMTRQKESLHHEVLEMIMGMLNKGLLLQSNKPIEASEKNAKLVKAYIYRKVSEKNPEMGGMDKILSIKTMGDSEIINIVKKMPDLDELEESIKKHLEEKSKNKQTEDKKNIDTSEASDISESEENTKKKSKKSSKKESKESKESKKSSKK
jgi:hypothetical protein